MGKQRQPKFRSITRHLPGRWQLGRRARPEYEYVWHSGRCLLGGPSCGAPQEPDRSLSRIKISGTDLGFINPGLYKIGSDSSPYAADFFDVTMGNNWEFAPQIPGYSASQG